MFRTYFLTPAVLFFGVTITFGQDDQPRRKKDNQKRFDPAQLFKQFDKNNDGFLEKDELPERMQQRFGQLDLNGDGKISRAELEKAAPRRSAPQAVQEAPADALFKMLDKDGDGKLSKEELQSAIQLLEKLDRNKDGVLDREELAPQKKKGAGRPGEIITPAAKGERIADRLKVGDVAPDFTLPLLSGKGEVALSSFRDKKTVVLVFASYT